MVPPVAVARLAPAGLVILLLLVAIRQTIYVFSTVAPGAAVLLVPYLLWVSFATLLNVAICRLNRSNRT